MRKLLLLGLACSLSAWAQFDTATVLGTVNDQSGAAVPASVVTLSNLANGTRQSVLTDSNGEYQFLNVRLGEYSLQAEAKGFKLGASEKFGVTVNARQRVDMTLQVGDATERIEVMGAASALETDSSDRGQVIPNRDVLNLPLNGRSYADLTLLVPGVRKSMLQDQSPTSREASYNVNGQRAESNNFILDGIDNNAYGTSNQGFSNQVVQVSPDAVSEYRVETNNFSAEYGHASGAVINATTKSGTNQLHVAAWEYMRNTVLNATGFFQPAGGVKPTYLQNQFGAAAGGPIKRDKLFLFADYEGQRRSIASYTTATVPTAAQRAGNLGMPVVNALTRALYSNGVVPAADIVPASASVLAALPLPNASTVSNNFLSLPKGTINDNKGDFRSDYYANSKLTAFVRYSHRESNIFLPGNIPGPAGGNNNGNVHIFNQQIDPGATWSISPTSALEVRFGIGWTEGGKTPLGLGQASLLTGIPNLPTNKLVAGAMNSISVSGFSQFGRQGSNPQFQNPFVLDPKLNYSRYMGRHTVKAGYEFLDLFTTIDDFNPAYGNFNFTGLFSKPTGGASGSLQTENYGVTDFLVGAPSHYELNNLAVVDYRQYMHFAYLQDDWKLTSRLTLNLGMRYEFAAPQWVADNRLANFDPATKSLLQAKPGDLLSRSLQTPQYGNWAPRAGFAWRLLPRTVIRSAFGISYQQFNRLGGENLLAYNGPNIVDAQIDQTPNQGICGYSSVPQSCFRPFALGYPENFASPSAFNPLRAQARYIPANNPTGYVESWHFTVQRELAKDWILDVAYVGNKGNHLMILADANQATPNTPSATCSATVSSGCASLQSRRPISNFAYIEVAYGAGFSSYNALQVKLEKRYSQGLYVLNSFTWSKAIDAASGHLETANGDNSRVNFYSIANEKGLSSYDQPLNNTTSITWELPYGKGRRFGAASSSVMRGLLGGWQMSMIDTLSSGVPVNLTYSPTSAFQVSTAPNYRPNVTGNPVTPEGQRTTVNYLNASTVTIPTDVSHPWGSAGRNIARGYPFYQLDLGLHKQFSLGGESRALEFRSEAFNLLNHTNFQAPDGNRSNSSFGSITSTFPARQLQFALKLMF